MSGDAPLLLFVRPLTALVGLRDQEVHLVPLPDPHIVPSVLIAYCGARFAPGTVELLSEFRGMPCVRCLAKAPLPTTHVRQIDGAA